MNNLKRYIFNKTKILLLIAPLYTIFCQSNTQLLNDLDRVLKEKPKYMSIKRSQIKNIENELHRNKINRNTQGIFNNYLALYEEYRSFKYDSAYHYLDEARNTALMLKSHEGVGKTSIEECFLLVSSGLFKEAFDSLDKINVNNLSEELKFKYYLTRSRAYYDLADYNQDERYTMRYLQLGNENLIKASDYVPKNTNEFWYVKTLLLIKKNEWKESEEAFLYWLKNFDTGDYYGIATSTLGYIYSQRKETEKAIKYLTIAALSDVKNATMETVALRNLANEIYKKGQYGKANEYVGIAMEDATFYNARHRKFEISSILPIIEKTQIQKVKQKNNLLTIIVSLLGITCLISIFLLWKFLKQLKERNQAKKILDESLTDFKCLNKNLNEANIIKEEYIAYFINTSSNFINKVDTIQKSTIQKINNNKYQEAITILKRYNVKNERENLYKHFDEIFLRLFPTYVQDFNSLFPIVQTTILKKGELLNTELRIYALYRLGIQDANKVANFLELSIATIYTYKTRIKARSNYKVDFEDKIMSIKSI